ncbi:MAG: PilZ domain-containing protein [Thermoanaerobaculia bacterium]|nr:PilZ domain-containing protein [Thermoanaerobaculia bacterium]
MPEKRIIAAIRDPQLFEKVEELFHRASFGVSRVLSGAGALVLLGNQEYDLVVVAAPLSDLGLDRFVRGMRSLDTEGRGSPLLVLVADEHEETVASALRGGRIEVLAQSAGWREIQRAVGRVLRVAARASRRMLVEIEAQIGSDAKLQLLQTVNLSRTGMLVRAAALPALGQEVRVVFTLPGEESPIEATAEVVRHAGAELPGGRGFAVRFVDLPAGTARRIAHYVEGELEADEAVDSDERAAL